ncbi:flavin monoamine oxidase family protein [Thermosediminibacter oceani]|uniref:Amine oxidase n=1 Tax=Thermosediminibacter oceani (strain ATCC BAA-1034 / DSM 16646 / JW/IW-1228P) TaxID=555079 RepID=D9S0U1_THEOJ|nr:NAD(P)/FAD-dependent oxidoreductase [Thermosediminibacter oceani]ADL07105.1 amine oxidase [Thermosediminibacter oceani DSM 16646]
MSRKKPNIVPSEPGFTPYMPDNPTDEERYGLLRYSLERVGRLEDFDNILKVLGPPPDITTIASPGEFRGVKVGIIGGGLAGLSAAFELRKLGFDITVFEALEDRIGGRIYTYYFDEEKKYYGELGAMRFPVSHETTWHYINLFKLPTRPFVQTNENAFIYVKGVRVRNDAEGRNVMERIYPKFDLNGWERRTPWEDLIFYALETPLLRMLQEVRPETVDVRPIYSPAIVYWDYFDVRRVMEEAGLSQDAIYLLGSLSPAVGSFLYNGYIEFLTEVYPAVFNFLYEIIGGMARLPLAFYESLTSPNPKEYPGIPDRHLGRVTWRRGTWVDGIFRHGEDGRVTLRYKTRYTRDCLQEDFDYVVCAIPFSTLRIVKIDPPFRNRKMQAIKEVNYIEAQKTLFLCKFRFWELGGPGERIVGGASYTDLPIQQIRYPSDHARCNSKWKERVRRGFFVSPADSWDMRHGYSPDEPGVLLASYNLTLDAARLGNIPDDVAFEIIKRQVEEVHGLPKGYLDPVVVDFARISWGRQPTFLGGFCYYFPEQKRIFSWASALPEYDGRVYFAGEHISGTHGWANGALKTGMEAANGIARSAKAAKIY